MEKMGVIGLFSCMIGTLVAMEDTRHLRDIVAQHAQCPTSQIQKSVQEVSCGICLEDMMPHQETIHTRCTSEHHIFHTSCLARSYIRENSSHNKECPLCLRPFSDDTEVILEKEGKKIKKALEAERLAARAIEEAANPQLRVAREKKEFWARFMHFTAVGLGLASVVAIPLVFKEYAYGPGPRGPVYAEAASVILPTTITVALPLEQNAQRLEDENR